MELIVQYYIELAVDGSSFLTYVDLDFVCDSLIRSSILSNDDFVHLRIFCFSSHKFNICKLICLEGKELKTLIYPDGCDKRGECIRLYYIVYPV